ncbi:putative membrane protein [Sphingomonas sp. S17]|jgi:hypothetical protein|uniref:Uncharacterized protein n=3 Tax=Sphingomonas paucimobilis TaxID=13689 RepID=A0A7Y2KPZ9_SPHPI|nr:hypothetical protein [Sphingomonas paucimobilis]EGI56005.1 putative membrane protein [Sphingomonas sp. S17]RSU68510.1 hypothetical protein BRX36_02995 [Sphingomonas sp. S-NIH.Pt1_0416]MDG5972061.1 hypothetical protein [Sphingomonas paucimobilis]NNG57933.1 hypothetical protein [Sphingomonas paucimobilis]QPS16457.1 hypothetical protein I6G65_01820 [Sphingomonas paucimobilis]
MAVAALLFLLLAVVMAFTGDGASWIVAATVVVAAIAGTLLPDLDTPLRLRHRSALLHSILPLFVATLDPRTWPVAAGLGFGIGLHLAADLFPSRMRGFATIKFPLWGSIGPILSYLWIATNAVANLLGGLILLGRVAQGQPMLAAMATVGIMGTVYLIRTDGGWCALGLFGLIGWLAFR